MKKVIFVVVLLLLSNPSLAASTGNSAEDKGSLYSGAKKLILRAKKLEKKDKVEKALKLYSKAHDKLMKAYSKDKKDADILNLLNKIKNERHRNFG